MSKDISGSAFPYVADADFDYGTGMTLRDYFAAKAITNAFEGERLPDKLWMEAAARTAYMVADAMLKAR